MTTFDPNATPICDQGIDENLINWCAFAHGLEIRARRAEEKLRIAVYELQRQAANYSDRYLAQEALEEIARVGK